MTKDYLTPAEIAEATITTGVKKANQSTLNMLLLGIFAGVYISLGAHADITIMQTFKHIDVGVMKFLGGAVFPIGLVLVLIAGGELFTGNCLMTMALVDKKITFRQMLKNWTLVYIGNFIGAILLVLTLIKVGAYHEGTPTAELAISIATGKTTYSFSQIFLKGIFANVLVVLAVWIAYGAQDITSKIIGMWFPVMTFVMLGFEHSIANMFFLPLARYIGFDITWAQIWTKNIIPATLGNIVGGAIIIPLTYYVVYILPKRKAETNKVNKATSQ